MALHIQVFASDHVVLYCLDYEVPKLEQSSANSYPYAQALKSRWTMVGSSDAIY
jgi:hypothetical protein